MNLEATSIEDRHFLMVGAHPTQKEMEYYGRLQGIMCIPKDDPLWMYIILMKHFGTRFQKLPGKVAYACEQAINNTRETAKDAMRATKDDLAKHLVTTLEARSAEIAKAAEEQANLDKAQTVTVCSIVFLIFFVLAFGVGLYFGQDMGHAAGLREATKIEMAGTWGATEAGQKAYQMYLSGDLESVMSCKAPGWLIEKGVCFPFRAQDNQYGWRLPQ